MKLKTKVLGGIAILAVLIGAATALAFYVGGGSGSNANAAKAGHAPVAVVVNVDTALSDVYPGEGSQSLPIEITVAAPGYHPARVNAVHLTLNAGSLPAGCDAAWFLLTDPVVPATPAGVNVTDGNPLALTGEVEFVDSGTDQGACSDADLSITAVTS